MSKETSSSKLNNPDNRRIAKRLAAGSLTLSIGVLLFSERGVDALGDSGRERSSTEMQQLAEERHSIRFRRESSVGKFALQFLAPPTIKVGKRDGDKGIAGFIASSIPTEYSIGSSCLANSAYDIDGGTISGRAHGNIPTSAAFVYVDAEKPDLMIVKSGNSQSVDLYFRGVTGDYLIPADNPTMNVLTTYGCDVIPKPRITGP
jgi:hypothetical protein